MTPRSGQDNGIYTKESVVVMHRDYGDPIIPPRGEYCGSSVKTWPALRAAFTFTLIVEVMHVPDLPSTVGSPDVTKIKYNLFNRSFFNNGSKPYPLLNNDLLNRFS